MISLLSPETSFQGINLSYSKVSAGRNPEEWSDGGGPPERAAKMLHGVNITAIIAKQNPSIMCHKFSGTLDGKANKDKYRNRRETKWKQYWVQ